MPLLPLEVIDKPAVVIPFVAEAMAEAALITDLKNRRVIPCQFYQCSEPTILDFIYFNICCSTIQENDSVQI